MPRLTASEEPFANSPFIHALMRCPSPIQPRHIKCLLKTQTRGLLRPGPLAEASFFCKGKSKPPPEGEPVCQPLTNSQGTPIPGEWWASFSLPQGGSQTSGCQTKRHQRATSVTGTNQGDGPLFPDVLVPPHSCCRIPSSPPATWMWAQAVKLPFYSETYKKGPPPFLTLGSEHFSGDLPRCYLSTELIHFSPPKDNLH